MWLLVQIVCVYEVTSEFVPCCLVIQCENDVQPWYSMQLILCKQGVWSAWLMICVSDVWWCEWVWWWVCIHELWCEWVIGVWMSVVDGLCTLWWYIAVVGAIHTLQLDAVCFPCEMNDITSPLFWYGISCRNDIHFCFLNLAINNTIIMFLSCSFIHSLFTNSPTLTHTITHHSFTPSLTHTNTHSHQHTLTPSLTHTNTHSHHHSLTPSHITHSHYHSLTPSLTRTITITHSYQHC